MAMNILSMIFAALFVQNAASVEGAVTKPGTNEPVSKAIVELRRDADDTVQYTAATSDDGKYVFRNVRPGKYRVVATRTGYVRVEYGQRRPGKRGTPIEVSSERVAGLQLVMAPTAAIFGRIYGPDGKPVIKASVQALKTSYQNGRRVLTAVQTSLTDDLGEYRLFWLTPGQYFVGVNAPNWNILGDSVTVNGAITTPSPGNAVVGMRFFSPVNDPLTGLRSQNPGGEPARYVPVYFPNTTDDEAAQPIDLRPGTNMGGIDILLAPLRTRRVRGVLIDAETGQPFKNTTPGYAYSIRTSPSTDGASTIVNPNTGAFDVQVVPGQVVLSVAGVTRTGRIVIPAGDTDIDGVQIVVTSGFALPGQIMIEGVDAAANDSRIPSFRVTLRGDPQLFTISPPQNSGVPSRAGAFAIQNVTPGDYRINVAPILNLGPGPPIPQALQNAYVKSIRLGDADVLNEGLQIGAQAPDRPLVIVVGTSPGSITGAALTDKQEPLSDVTVVLVPDVEQRRRVDLYRSTTTDAMGRFKMERIPPGKYKLFAWDDVENGAWQDAQFMRTYEDRGKPITIADGAQQDVLVPVILPR